MKLSAALCSALHAQAVEHLLRLPDQEDLCFAIWHPSQGAARYSALISELILPMDGERFLHGNASFHVSYFERSLGLAVKAGGGLALLHSHCWPGWQNLSKDDAATEGGYAAASAGATGLPLVGLTMGNDGALSARFWERTAPRTYQPEWCESVRVVGERLESTFHPRLSPPPVLGDELIRTISAWGELAQQDIARLHVGIIGAGSVGSIIGQLLAKSGLRFITAMDFDRLKSHNFDRQLGMKRGDLHELKVDVLAREIRSAATAPDLNLTVSTASVVEEGGFKTALDCDILISCVDRPWPRSVLNYLAYAHLIPVIDGGISIKRAKHRGMQHGNIRAHTCASGRRCLACLGQYDPGLVATEREGRLDDPRYIESLPAEHALRRHENVIGFSCFCAGLEFMQLQALVTGGPVPDFGAHDYDAVTGSLVRDERGCDQDCPYPSLTALGDHGGVTVTGRHLAAETERGAQTNPA